METNQPLDEHFSDNLQINTEIRNFLTETAKWANFIAIVAFVFLGIYVFMLLFMMGSMGSMMMGEMGAFGGGFMMLFMILVLGISAIPIFYLYRFAQNTKRALKTNDQAALTAGLGYLKSHYKFYGIMLAVIIGFYVLILVGGLLFGGLSALM